MTFEEFFKKKRIDLSALQKAEMGLFSEFKTHYHEMGEKSFDHTKKYWFNKLRRQFPLAVEVKTEKPKAANPLAEQTITESLDEQIVTLKTSFVPRFKANIAKPAAQPSTEEKKEEQAAIPPTQKQGFTPRFKAANLPKPATEQEEKAPEDDAPSSAEPLAISPENTEAKPAYKPRFNPKNIPRKDE
jgi:hypothetical protein